MTTSALELARDIVRQLSPREKLFLLSDLTAYIIHDTAIQENRVPLAFPIFHVEHWPTNVPLRREEMYDDRGR